MQTSISPAVAGVWSHGEEIAVQDDLSRACDFFES